MGVPGGEGAVVEPARLGLRRSAALGVTTLVALVVLWPVLAHPDTDGFPLSTYPMFAARRPRVASFATVVGIDDRNRSHWLSPTLVNGTREVVQAAAVVGRQVVEGRSALLCAEVASRLADAGRDDLDAVEVVTVSADPVAYFADGPTGSSADGFSDRVAGGAVSRADAARPTGAELVTLHARCPVPR